VTNLEPYKNIHIPFLDFVILKCYRLNNFEVFLIKQSGRLTKLDYLQWCGLMVWKEEVQRRKEETMEVKN